MKKTEYLYLDLETTQVVFNKDEYKNIKDYFENHPNPIPPKIYSFGVGVRSGVEVNSKYKHEVYNDEFTTYDDISGASLIDYIENINCDVIGYFNNLKGFDGHFLIPELDKAGYTNVLPLDIQEVKELTGELKITYMKRLFRIREKVLSNPANQKHYNKIKMLSQLSADKWLMKKCKRQWNLLLPKEYSVMTDGSKNIYEIKIGIQAEKTTKGKTKNRAVILRDNLTIFPTSVKNMGETIVKMKHGLCECYKHGDDKCKELTERKKLEERYLKKDLDSGYNRTELYKSKEEFHNDGNEREYLLQDIYTLFAYHKELEQYFERPNWKLTVGSTVYEEWISTFGTKLLNKKLELGHAEYKILKRGAKRVVYKGRTYNTKEIRKKLINEIIPTDWLDKPYSEDKTIHQELYEWYDGGITRVNEDYRGQYVDDITFIDINSSYPSQMVKDVNVPYGRGIKGDVKSHPFKFYTLIPKKKIVNKKGLPFLHNIYASKREYLKVLKPNTAYKFTSITYERFLKYYECNREDYELVVNFSFKQIKIKTFFEEFITKWYDVKEQASLDGNEILKIIAKLFMNNLYGKYGTKSVRDSQLWNQFTKEWEKYETELSSKYYLPLGIVIAELGRMSLVDAVDYNHDEFVYCDTDSIAVTGFKIENYKNVELHPSKLGKWDIEFDNAYGIVRRPKQYLLKNNTSKVKLAFAGINFNRLVLPDKELKEVDDKIKLYEQLSLKDMVLGATIENQLASYKLVGSGIAFNQIEKDIKPVWDYEPLSEQKYFLPEHFKETIKKLNTL